MYMSFDRQSTHQRPSHGSVSDATGTPFTTRSTPDGARPSTERRDYREQADGAP
jgi:hypothetical protein